jgi:hypothetical protein
MLNYTHHQQSQFVKIVYAKQVIDGRLQLIPFELYTDGTIRRSES